MKIILLVLLQLHISAYGIAQTNTKSNYAVLKVNTGNGDYMVFYENNGSENLADSLKVGKYLADHNYSAEAADKVLFECLEYMNARGFELITFALHTNGAWYSIKNKWFYKEYIFKKKLG
jgi:hypothetical protein